MTKTICKVVYDTEKSTIIRKVVSGQFGDPTGYEETLYQTESGAYFIYVNGGADSIHPTEDIKRIAKTKVDAWIAEH